jgi:hypothetical protein
MYFQAPVLLLTQMTVNSNIVHDFHWLWIGIKLPAANAVPSGFRSATYKNNASL